MNGTTGSSTGSLGKSSPSSTLRSVVLSSLIFVSQIAVKLWR
jgi:hypothetical protein